MNMSDTNDGFNCIGYIVSNRRMIVKERNGWKWLQPVLRCYPSICLEWPRKTLTILCQDSWSLDQD